MSTFSGFKHKILLLTLGVCLAFLATAQDYNRTLSWQQQPKDFIDFNGAGIKQPTFTGAAHFTQYNLLPVYIERIPLNTKAKLSVQIINAVYSPATNLDGKSAPFIKSTVEATATLSIRRQQPSATIQILPFRKNSAGAIEKLESFTIRLTATPIGGSRSTNAYAANSSLSSGNWYKVAVTGDGMYKIDYDFVKNTLKIDPASFNLNTLAVFGNGGGMVPDVAGTSYPDDLIENPTMVVDNNGNNKMDDGDYLLFYGQMPDAWTYNSGNQTFQHQKNLYSDKDYYFITTDEGTGKRVQSVTNGGSPTGVITDFDEHFFHESDEYNTLQSGKMWIGDKMTYFNNAKSFSYTFPNLETATRVKVNSVVAANTPYGSTITVGVNNTTLITHVDGGIPSSSYPDGAEIYSATANYNATGDQLNISYTFNVTSDPSGTAAGYIDYFELLFKRALSLSGDAMAFRSIASLANNVSQFQLQNAGGNTRVWDVTDIGNIQQMGGTLSGSQFSFVANTSTLREFIAFNTNGAFSTPEFIEKTANQDLHATQDTKLVIVTYDGFEAPSNELANFHRTYDGISSTVVKLSQVYNEFGGGKPDISAIRNFMKMLYDRANGDTTKMPAYLLLMGDGSYDPKGRIANSNNFIPCYESYVSQNQLNTYTSDDFYGLLDNGEGGDITSAQQMDLGVGRLPAESEQEAWDMVNKIKNYRRPTASTSCTAINTSNNWRNVVTFIADDLDNGGDVFETSSEALAENTRGYYPVYNYDKIYLDAYKQVSTPAGARYPDVNTAIMNRINTGTLVINWVGHGGETNWAHERIFNQSDIAVMTNQYLPLFVTATCDFSRYDLPDRTAGEQLITNARGGGIASVTTVRLVFQSANDALDTELFKYLLASYHGRYPTLGEVIMETKNNVITDWNNTRKFTLLGDPAMQLDYPHYKVATTQVNNKPVSMPHDTLKALSQVTIKGEIRDDNNNKLTSFSGFVYPIVYDKISVEHTLGNDIPGDIMNFPLYKNAIYKGKATVTNGDFSYTFIVPKDINYQYGAGRISYYADNGSYVDANGYSTDIVVGGAADSFLTDHDGPKMNVYMNDSSFVFGGITNNSPILLVKLQDQSGINTAGTGIGHSITAVLDNDDQNKIVLNDYYQTLLDNYKQGTITYPFSKLADGKHSLKIKAWDVQDNSADGYTEFIVSDNAKLALNHVFNYPNPFTTRTQFMFEHNKPCDDLHISIQIYSITGKVVKSIQTETHCTGFRVSDIDWDGRDDYGDAIGKGVYVYKVSVRDAEGETAHKFEKLVILR